MDQKTNNKIDNKKSFFKKIKIFLLIVIIISILIVMLYLALNNLKKNKNNNTIEHTQPTFIQPQINVDNNNEQIQELKSKINTLTMTNESLQNQLIIAQNNKSHILKNELFSIYQLLNMIQTSEPFTDTLNAIIAKNHNINNLLTPLIPLSKGVLSLEELINIYQKTIYKDVYMHYLKQQKGILAFTKSLLYNLIFIKNTNPSVTDNISYNLYLVESNLVSGNLETALSIFKANFNINKQTQGWIDSLDNRIIINNISKKLTAQLTQ